MLKKDKIVKIYAACSKSLGRHPIRQDLLKKGISRDAIRYHFGDMETLKNAAHETYPESFSKVIDTSYFNNETFGELQTEVKKHKRFVITTAVGGAPVHKGFLAAIKNYCKLKKALLLVIPANYALYDLDPVLVENEHIVFRDVKLNSNISISSLKIDPKQVDPCTGLDAFGEAQTVIIGSPKQRRVPVPNSNSKLARIIQATGAITSPNYVPKDGIPKRRDTLAEMHHKMGAVVVEVVNDIFYHMRHIEMASNGSFNDLFYKYTSEDNKFVGCAAIVQGDKHVGDTDPEVNKAVDEMCAAGRPKYRIEHDFFNGASISHYSIKNKVDRAIAAEKNKISLDRELRITAEEVARVRKLKTSEIHVIVESNHNEWLMRYLNLGEFDDNNRKISTKLQLLAMDGEHPLKAAIHKIHGVPEGKDVRWLGIDEDFRIAGIELGAHGHLGNNGHRNPGVKGMAKTYGKVMFGHGHHGEIWHGSMMVGTSTFLKLDYNRGGSSWDNSQGIVYQDGTRQIVNVIKGNWRLSG